MNADKKHRDAKNTIIKGYHFGKHAMKTLDQWIIWILEIQHCWVWNEENTKLDTPNLKQITIDESFWGRGRVNKHMAPGQKAAATWIWAAVEVDQEGHNGKAIFRVMRSSDQAV